MATSRADSNQTIADVLFVVQIGCTVVSGGSQFLRLLTTAEGINVSWLASWLAFLLINLTLTTRAYRRQPRRVTRQAVMSYALWTAFITANLLAMVWQGKEVWDHKDTVTTGAVALGLMATWLYARRAGLPLTDPLVSGCFGVVFIGLPQITLAYKIFLVGGRGLAGGMILAGHLGIMTRMGQLWYAIKATGWDRNLKGAALSEMVNEATWLLITVSWLWRY